MTPETDPRYPVGPMPKPEQITEEDRLRALEVLAELPSQLRNAVRGLDPTQLGTPYREGGWTVQQVVHHVADSHMNAVIRVKLALTEESPRIVAYDEKAWALLPDAEAPIEWSLELIESLHARWVLLLQRLNAEQWRREYVHPERGATTLEEAALQYAWHSRHHLAHIVHLRQREGW